MNASRDHQNQRRSNSARKMTRKRLHDTYKVSLKRVDVPTALGDAMKHNDLPPTLATQLAQGLLSKLETSLTDAETRILEIEDQILALQREKDNLIKQSSPSWAKMRVCDTVLSVFRRMPMDVLQEIASYAKPSQPSLDTTQSPMLLSHVCRKWRRAVHEMPYLWRELYLEVELGVGNDKVIQRYASQVKEWFSYTGSLSLSLRLYTPSDTRDIAAYGNLFVKHFLNPLRSTLLRVQHWGIGAPWVTDFLALFSGKFAANTKSITIRNKRQKEPEELHVDYPQLMHHITDLALTLDRPFNRASMFSRQVFPWSNLTSLEMSGMLKLDGYVLLLDACPKLHFGQFNIMDFSPSALDEDLRTPFHAALDHLSLTIVSFNLNLSQIFLRYGFYPESLELCHFGDRVEDYAQNNLGSFLFMEHIQTLAITGAWGEAVVFVEYLLSQCEALTDLHISVEIPPHHLLELLTRMDSDFPKWGSDSDAEDSSSTTSRTESYDEFTRFLPMLSHLSIHIPSNIDGLDVMIPSIVGALSKMLTARASESTRPSQRLSSFCISTKNPKLRSAIQATIKAHRRPAGVEFEVGSSELRPRWTHRAVDVQLIDWQSGVDKRLEIREQARQKLVAEYKEQNDV